MVWRWSKTAASNSNADSSINWAEGMAPSAVNDSSRAEMARVAQWRDDISGAIVTGGTSTAYTVSSNQVFDTLAHMDGAMIAFSPHVINGATVTLNVDSLGPKPLRLSPAVELQSNTLIGGTPYVALYSNADAVWYLRGLGGNAYGVPLGGGMDFWLPTAPSSAFVFPTGQAISRTTYATLFAAMGTTHGSGDGSLTFNLPDKTERVSVMKAAAAARLTAGYFGGDSTQLGATGGGEKITMARSDLPNASISVAITDPGHAHSLSPLSYLASSGGVGYGSGARAEVGASNTGGTLTGITAAFNLNGNVTQTLIRTVQPTIVCNYIMRII